MEHHAYLALGANIGDRLGYLGKAILHLSQHPDIRLVTVSSVYETDPVGYLDQEPFYNMVIHVQTTMNPHDLIQLCLQVEQRLGRIRTIVNGPRTIDIDVLYFDDIQMDDEQLILPHPRLQDRTFVLVPLVEIAADFVHPVFKQTNEQMLAKHSQEGIRKLAFTFEN